MAGLPAQPAAYSRRVPAGSREGGCGHSGATQGRPGFIKGVSSYERARGRTGCCSQNEHEEDDWLYEADGSARYLQEENVVSAVGC